MLPAGSVGDDAEAGALPGFAAPVEVDVAAGADAAEADDAGVDDAGADDAGAAAVAPAALEPAGVAATGIVAGATCGVANEFVARSGVQGAAVGAIAGVLLDIANDGSVGAVAGAGVVAEHGAAALKPGVVEANVFMFMAPGIPE